MVTCSAGTRLGPYEIISRIGAGGMGEVWKAHDSRLGRPVAIKVSAAQFSQRFEREARVIAALNHPHICTLHDVGPDFLVMEYVEGAPLRGPLPLDKAIEYAKQILAALDAAHRRGIVHRDLKPGNILVTKSGIKLLDFGLAKAAALQNGDEETIGKAVTQDGMIAGTLQYISPEQLQDGHADGRSDIFGFGCVFYEMLTGKRAFEGKTAASVIAAVLEREAPSIAEVAPPGLDWLLKKCLAKDPEERWQSARDVKAALEGSLAGYTVPARSNRWRERIGWIAALAFLVAALFLAVRLLRLPAGHAELVSFLVYPPEGTVFSGPTTANVGQQEFALSPNGRAIAFVANRPGSRSLPWVRTFEEVQAHPLPGTDGVDYPFWSPDSVWLAFFAGGRLKKIRAGGGPVQTILEDTPELPDVRGGAWGLNDVILVGTVNGPIYRISAGGGAVRPATRLDIGRKEGSHRWPSFLPDGRHFLFTIRSELADSRGIYVGSLDSETKTRLINIDSNAVYVPPGYILFTDGDTLFGREFNAERLVLSGQPFTIVGRVGRAINGSGAFAASATGVLAHGGIDFEGGRLTWFDRKGKPLGSVGPEGYYSDFRLSPDNRRLALSLVDPESGNLNIWIADVARNSLSRFTAGTAMNMNPLWSPNGNRIVFATTQRGVIEFYEKSSGGGGDEEPLLAADPHHASSIYDLDWSPNGRDLLYSMTPRSGTELWILSLKDRKRTRLMRGMHASFSADGRLLTYVSDESGKTEVYVQTFPLSDRKWQISSSGGSEPRWRGDGREIYYLSEDHKLMAVEVGPGPSFDIAKPLFQTRVITGRSEFQRHYVPARDGRRFLINTRSDSPPKPITINLNWTAGLR